MSIVPRRSLLRARPAAAHAARRKLQAAPPERESEEMGAGFGVAVGTRRCGGGSPVRAQHWRRICPPRIPGTFLSTVTPAFRSA